MEIEPLPGSGEEIIRLDEELAAARQQLLDAEQELAEEQAAVNSFRMHCRLKLDAWIENLLTLQTKRQSLLTRIELMKQATDLDFSSDETDPFWEPESADTPGHESTNEGDGCDESLILPTDTPRDKAAEKRLYRQLARKFHPDLGVTAVEIAYRTEMMAAVNIAYRQDDVQALYDLAGEMDPSERLEIAAIRNIEIRQLRRQIIQCQRRRKRAERRLAALRRENTARLWRKARYLDESGTDWWEVVRREIEQAIVITESEVQRLQKQLQALSTEQQERTAESSSSDGS